MNKETDQGLGLPPRLEVLRSIRLPVAAVERSGRVIMWNEGAAALLGLSEEEMLGQPLHRVQLEPEDAAIAETVLEELVQQRRWDGEVAVRDAEGRPRRLQLSVVAPEPQGDGECLVIFATDVTRRLEAERQATESLARLNHAQRVARLAWFEWDIPTDQVIGSELLASDLGLDSDEAPTMTTILRSIPETDQVGVSAAIDRLAWSDSVSVRFRVRRGGGDLAWREANCEAVRGREGELRTVRGTVQDVTQEVVVAEELRDAATFWQATLDALSANVAVLDEQGTIVAVNARWRRFSATEGGSGDYVGANYLAVCEASGDHGSAAVTQGLRELLTGEREELRLEYPCHSPTTQRFFELRAARCDSRDQLRVVMIHEEVTERHRAQERIALQASLLDEVDVAVIHTDPDFNVLSWNAGAERLYGWQRDEALGTRLDGLLVSQNPASVNDVEQELTSDGRSEGEYRLRRRDGTPVDVFSRTRTLLDSGGQHAGFVGISIDISDRKRSERELVEARNYLRAVTDSIGEGVFTLDNEGRLEYMNRVAMELLGWKADEIKGKTLESLIRARGPRNGSRPEQCQITAVRRSGEIARVEDDVFIRKDGTAMPVSYTAAPIRSEDRVAGCVVVFEDITDRKAEAERMQKHIDKLTWVRRVQDAIKEQRFVLYAQPIVHLSSGEVVQRELLLRMHYDDAAGVTPGFVTPGSFLPVAEEFGFVAEIDRWVIDRSAEIAAGGVAVELNISGFSIGDRSLIDHIGKAVERTGADPQMMVFEITETTLINDEQAARLFVERLHALGCKVALDDFGTGYGGFTYLKRLPIDYLKIDVEFVRDARYSPASRHVVQAIVSLAASFGLETIAEGVEDEETFGLLVELGVDYAQGFHIGRPAPLPGDGPVEGSESPEAS